MPEVYAQRFALAPRGVGAEDAIVQSLRDWARQRMPEVVGFDFVTRGALEGRDGSILRWEPHEDEAGFLLDFTWRHKHLDNDAITWSTRASFLIRPQGDIDLSLRVANTGPDLDGPDGLSTSRPRLLLHLREYFELRCDSAACRAQELDENDVIDVARYVLCDPNRQFPVLMLSPVQARRFQIEPEDLEREFLSLGRVYFLNSARAAYALSDEFRGRRLSVFGGALRVYMPGFRLDTDPFRHPLLLPVHLANAQRRRIIAQSLAIETTHRFEEMPELAEIRDRRALAYDRERRAAQVELLDARKRAEEIGDYSEIVELLDKDNQRLDAELEALRERHSVLESKNRWLAGERDRLMALATGERKVPEIVPAGLEPASVREAVENANELYGDTLYFLPSAFDTAASSPFRRPNDVLMALGALDAVVEQQNTPNGLGMSIREALKEKNVDFRSGISKSTSKRLKQQFKFTHEGQEHTCEEHICLGSTYDPAECLRIYLNTKKRIDGKVVIAHVGRHLDVISTS